MSNESSKPREWVLSSHYSYDYDAMKWSVYGGIISNDALPEKVKVIEKSAYDQALARIKLLEEVCAKLMDNIEGALPTFHMSESNEFHKSQAKQLDEALASAREKIGGEK